MNLVQLFIPEKGRRLGIVKSNILIDVTSKKENIKSTYDAFIESKKANGKIDDFLKDLIDGSNCTEYDYTQIYNHSPNGKIRCTLKKNPKNQNH